MLTPSPTIPLRARGLTRAYRSLQSMYSNEEMLKLRELWYCMVASEDAYKKAWDERLWARDKFERANAEMEESREI